MEEVKKIAIIDDDVKIRQLLKSVLSTKKEYAVITFAPTLELLQILQENKFDLLIVDYMMPNIDGLELILHYSSLFKNAPIILITSYPFIEQVQVMIENKESMNLKIVTKPFDINQMLEIVTSILDSSNGSVEQ